MKKTGLIFFIVFLVFVMSSPGYSMKISPGELNQKIEVLIPSVESNPDDFIPKIRESIRGYEKIYIKPYVFSLKKAAKLTVYMEQRADGNRRMVLLSGRNPFASVEMQEEAGIYALKVPQKETFNYESFTQRVNMVLYGKTEGREIYALCISEKPSDSFSIMVKSPSDDDTDVLNKQSLYGKDRAWGDVITEPFIVVSSAETDVIQETPPARNETEDMTKGLNLSGSWLFIDEETGIITEASLNQYGSVVTGIRRVEKGNIPIVGEIVDKNIILKLLHENPEVTSTYVPLKVAMQVQGITSKMDYVIGEEPDEFHGNFYGFYAQWDKNNRKLIRHAHGGTELAQQHNPVRKYTMKRAYAKQEELADNGELVPGLYLPDWNVQEWYHKTDECDNIRIENDGIRFIADSGNSRNGIMQEINKEVSSYNSVQVVATVKVDEQTEGGTGKYAREAPVSLFVKYTDINGGVHDLIGEDVNSPQRMFWQGFYIIEGEGGETAAHGRKIVKGEWHQYSFDLMSLEPRPQYIHFIGAEGSGRAPRNGKIRSLHLKAR